MTFPPGRTAVLAIVIAGVVFGAFSLAYWMNTSDTAGLSYSGNVIVQGGIPYRDAYIQHGPGVHFAYAARILLLGKSHLALRVFDVLWQTLTALVLAWLCHRAWPGPAVASIAGVSYLFAYFAQDPHNMAQPDAHVSLPVALAFAFLVRASGGPGWWPWLLTGSAVAAAALVKLPWGLVGVPALVLAFRGRPPLALAAGRLGALAAGFLGPIALCAAYYAAKGGLPHLLDAQFVYAAEYVRAAQARVTLGCAYERMSRTVFLPLHVMAAVTAGGLLVMGLQHRRPPLVTTLAVTWLGVGLLVLGASALFLEYHHLPLIAPLAVASAPVLVALVRAVRNRRPGAWLVLGLVAVSLYWPAQKFVEKARMTREIVSGRLVHPWNQLGVELGRQTRPDETLFVWGNAPIVYVSADRRAASRFMNVVPVTMPLPEAGNAARRRLLLEEVAANRPRYFVYQKVRLNHAWIAAGCIMPTDVPGTWERFDALRRLVNADYEPVEDTERWTVFRRKSGGGS